MPQQGFISDKHKLKLRRVHDWIRAYQKAKGYAPSRRDIASAFETSTSVIGFDLDCMTRLGWINIPAHTARAITLLPIKEKTQNVQLHQRS